MQEFSHEPLGSPLISLRLHEDVEHFALSIDGAPEIHSPAADRDGHLVEVPCRTGHAPRGAKAPRTTWTEGYDPSSNRLMRYVDPALGEQLLDITVAQREAKIDPDRVLNDFGRKAISGIGNGRHPDPVPIDQPALQSAGCDKPRTGIALVMTSAIVSSFGGTIARFLTTDDSWAIVFLLSIWAAAFLVLFLLWRDGRKTILLFKTMGYRRRRDKPYIRS